MTPSLAGVHHLKFPTANIDASLAWFEEVMLARREPRFDHVDPDGRRYGVLLFLPGLNFPVELRLAPKAAAAVSGYDPVTFGVADHDAILRWAEHFDAVGAAHSGPISGYIGTLLELDSIDGLPLRLYTLPTGGFADVEFHPERADLDNPALDSALMERD